MTIAPIDNSLQRPDHTCENLLDKDYNRYYLLEIFVKHNRQTDTRTFEIV